MSVKELCVNSENTPELFAEVDFSQIRGKQKREEAAKIVYNYLNMAYPNYIKCNKVSFNNNHCVAHIVLNMNDKVGWANYAACLAVYKPEVKPTERGFVRIICKNWVNNGYMTEMCDELMTLIMT